jgi:hypothetical protein
MNFLAHGYCWLDRPYFLAGTAVPDWLVVADRSLRLRWDCVEAHCAETDGAAGELLQGMLQHLRDDLRFHSNSAFIRVSRRLTRQVVKVLGEKETFLSAFLGHLVIELLLDAAVAREDFSRISRYYHALAAVSPELIESVVSNICGRPTDRLAPMIRRFLGAQVLWDYLDDGALMNRVNQILGRVGISPVGEEFLRVLPEARLWVEAERDRLLAGIPAGPEVSPR